MIANIPETDLKRIVIIGDGFAGLKLAQKLLKSKYQVVLIDKENYHSFQPLMYQVATAGLEPSSIAFPLRKLFQHEKNFHIRNDEVISIDTENKNIRLKKQSNTMIKLISEGKFKPKTNNVYNGKIIEINGQKYRSSWDAMFHILKPDLQYEGIVIPYKIDNKIRNYFVDFVDNKNKILYEIKPKIRHNDKKNIIKFEALKKYSEKNNFTYKIIDEIYILDNIDKLNLNELPELMIRRLKCFLKKKGLVQ